METEFLQSLVIIFGASAVVVFLLYRLKVPSFVGFIIAGLIIGPYGIGIVKDTHAIELLAEIGVILLLFTIGVEFSLARLLRIKKAVTVGGGMQVLTTIVLSFAIARIVTGNTGQSLLFGFLIALSSTAIVLKLLSEKGEIDSPHGHIITGILIFQDICVVPLMLIIPSLSGEVIDLVDVGYRLGKAVLIIVVVLLSARWIVPNLLHQVVSTRSRELFITSIIMLCLGIALFTSKFGLSLALGAFLAGLIISESEYAHQAISDILPFKDSFLGLFFVSVGMLIDISYMTGNILLISVTVLLVFILKTFTGTVAAMTAGNSLRVSFHTGLGLAQIGEFSFVLAIAGKEAGIVSEDFYQIFLLSSVVSMIMTPFVLKAAPALSARLTLGKYPHLFNGSKNISGEGDLQHNKKGHVIIIGFGLNGRNLARVLKEAEIPYTILEMNSDTVREMMKKGEPIYYGDGSSKEILHKLGIGSARLLVVAISDPVSTRRIVSIARYENPDVYIIVRTRYITEVDDLRSLGANEVIPEEFETSVEIFSRVLHRYAFPGNVIMDMVDSVRNDSYTVLRSIELPRRNIFEKCDWLPEIEMEGYRVSEGSHLLGKNISELQVRVRTGATIIAVRRGPEVYSNPTPDFRFMAGDIILFTGERRDMNKALHYFKGEN